MAISKIDLVFCYINGSKSFAIKKVIISSIMVYLVVMGSVYNYAKTVNQRDAVVTTNLPRISELTTHESSYMMKLISGYNFTNYIRTPSFFPDNQINREFSPNGHFPLTMRILPPSTCSILNNTIKYSAYYHNH